MEFSAFKWQQQHQQTTPTTLSRSRSIWKTKIERRTNLIDEMIRSTCKEIFPLGFKSQESSQNRTYTTYNNVLCTFIFIWKSKRNGIWNVKNSSTQNAHSFSLAFWPGWKTAGKRREKTYFLNIKIYFAKLYMFWIQSTHYTALSFERTNWKRKRSLTHPVLHTYENCSISNIRNSLTKMLLMSFAIKRALCWLELHIATCNAIRWWMNWTKVPANKFS